MILNGVEGIYELRFGEPVFVPNAAPMVVTKKACPGCGRTLPRYWFSRQGDRVSGLASRCVPCLRGWDPAWNVDEVLRLISVGLIHDKADSQGERRREEE